MSVTRERSCFFLWVFGGCGGSVNMWGTRCRKNVRCDGLSV